MRAIYEVEVDVDGEIATEYEAWLRSHMREIVTAAGFERGVLTALNHSPGGNRIWVVQYWAANPAQIDSYLENLAPKFRADGLKKFGTRFRAKRRVLLVDEAVPDLTVPSEKSDSGANNRKDDPMSTQASWQKIRNEFSRITSVEDLRSEVHRIGKELRKLDLQSMLSPAAQAKVKMFEKRYAELMRTMQQAQRQVDREFNKILRQIKTQKGTMSKVVNEQKSKLNDLRKKFTASAAKATKKSAVKRATSKTKGTKKRRKS